LGKDKEMTTWTTEDRMNASPPHIVDSGASVKTLGDYIEQESREEMLREQLHVLNEEIKRLTDENMKLKREIDNLMDGRC
jgi:predicted RNase H-like nuclease (RuvC/YqgF family)